MDRLDEMLKRHYKKIKQELIPSKGACPAEGLLWGYVKRELTEQEREAIDGHLLACEACLENLKAIRMLHQAEHSAREVPVHLHQKAAQILKEAMESGLRKKKSPVLLKLALLWDEALGRIMQLAPQLGQMGPVPEFQPVRNGHEVKEAAQSFPYTRRAQTEEGSICVQIDRSGKEGYLSLKIAFQPKPEGKVGKVNRIRAVLYKGDRVCASVYLNHQGEAVFTRIKEGEYSLELLSGERSLGMVELTIGKVKK
jgi:hypothetical protein